MNFDSFVLAAVTSDLSAVAAARPDADAVEFRMDYAEDALAQLSAYDGELPVIATNRVAWEGGDAADTDARLEELATAIEHESVEAVDLELEALVADAPSVCDASPIAELARGDDTAVIASVHDFEGTPPRDHLEDLLTRASSHGDVGKLAVTATEPGEVLDLLAATWSQTQTGNTVATMAMGASGRHSRAVCPLYGSRIGYAPLEESEATAPGQYDLQTLRSLIDRLDGDEARTTGV